MNYKDKIKNVVIREIVEWIEVIVIAFILAMVIKTFVMETTQVSGNSMENTLKDDEKLLVNRFIYKFKNPERGDIIVFLPDNEKKNYIKRVIALPGETVDLKDGKVYVNGERLIEDYISPSTDTLNLPNGKEFPYTLGDEEYLAFGDNRMYSLDCRAKEVGILTKKKMRGQAVFRIYPFNKFGTLKKTEYNEIPKEYEK